MRIGIAAALAAFLMGSAAEAACPMFPPDNPWNQPADSMPTRPDSAAWVRSLGAARLQAGFGTSTRYGFPVNYVSGIRGVRVDFSSGYPRESDQVPYPIPRNPKIEGPEGNDEHLFIVDQGTCKLYELYEAHKVGGRWTAISGAVWNLNSNALRPAGWTSADAAGLPMTPGLVRYEEVAAGSINHALRFVVGRTARGYIHPARHSASNRSNPSLPVMGSRWRLPASFDTSGFTGQAKPIVEALKRYGMFLADHGPVGHLSGSPDPRWREAELAQLRRIPMSAFEVADTGPVVGR